MYLEVGAFLSGEDGLVREIGYEERILSLLEGKGRRLSQDGEYYLDLSLLVDPQDIAVLGHAVHFLLDDDGTGQLVGIGGDGPALLQPLPVHAHSNL